MDTEKSGSVSVGEEIIEGGVEVPADHDPDSPELRRQSDHDHDYRPILDPLNRHPGRVVCRVCGVVIDNTQQSQPWAPKPRIARAGI
jgi:hypothetical protein